ncbi:MAG TPA: hypothetical protein VJ476_00230 [Rhizomicrobium sp.]|nr:hypothetical protein [Rhizomicrobium sp.]
MNSYARNGRNPSPPAPISPEEFARYTRELLESLRKMAIFQGQTTLAHLLGLAAMEAKHLGGQAQDT